jgi:hypothetical protein
MATLPTQALSGHTTASVRTGRRYVCAPMAIQRTSTAPGWTFTITWAAAAGSRWNAPTIRASTTSEDDPAISHIPTPFTGMSMTGAAITTTVALMTAFTIIMNTALASISTCMLLRVTMEWVFMAAPWYGYYGAYFTPYPVYAAPALWLTDYLISASLAAAYEAHVAAQAQAEVAGTAPPAPLTPETKQMIADEVKRQVALENAEAQANGSQQEADAKSSSIARILSDGQPHVFVPGKEFDLTAASGQECAVTDGDVLQLKAPPAADATAADLVVLSSKGGVECPRLTTVSVPIEDLQDMQNHMRETIDMGLQELQAKQGKGGLPAAPPSATAPPVAALVAQGAPPPDPAGAQDLAKQAQESEKAEQEVLQSAAAPTGAANGAAPAP